MNDFGTGTGWASTQIGNDYAVKVGSTTWIDVWI